jgi:hypothetical protein
MTESTEEWSEPIVVDTGTASKDFVEPVYKEWFRSKDRAGFISISPWLTGAEGESIGKLTVEIGSVDPHQQKVTSSTRCYPDAVELYTYLNVILYGPNNIGHSVYPSRKFTGSPESFLMFGGSKGADPVSRVFKVEWWPGEHNTGEAFIWKCGSFKGKVTGTGAIEPDFNSPISVDSIKRTRLEMFRIHARLQLLLGSWASNNKNWFVTGK